VNHLLGKRNKSLDNVDQTFLFAIGSVGVDDYDFTT